MHKCYNYHAIYTNCTRGLAKTNLGYI